eukprot:TRINITY_DN1993_c0_g1_i1.p1 TRINITY_DN1993_c0_g1~~TRINITY_DN1993_c0_g1_i1.p1  ORF type:complete len:250 (+),score=80.11 TRINITY_DN1993_c0_g1_i1:81-830(+)
MATINLSVSKCPGGALAKTNHVFLNPVDYGKLNLQENSNNTYVKIFQFVYTASRSNKVQPGSIGFNTVQRSNARLGLNDLVEVKYYRLEEHKQIYLSCVDLEVDILKKKKGGKNIPEFNAKDIEGAIGDVMNLQFLVFDQQFVIEVNNKNLLIRVNDFEVVGLQHLDDKEAQNNLKGKGAQTHGLLTRKTVINLSKGNSPYIRIKGSKSKSTPFNPKWNFESMGIGGLGLFNFFSFLFSLSLSLSSYSL